MSSSLPTVAPQGPASAETARQRQPESLSPSTAEDELNARSAALAERVKELKCLHSISGLLKGRHADLGEILQKIVDVLPSAWRYPDRASACITFNGRRYCTRNFREPRWRQQAAITVGSEQAGLLEIGYAEALNGQLAPEFLEEEQALLLTVAERVAEIVALKEARNQLVTYQTHLRSLASELTLAEERERRRLAVALHDRIGQGLAVAKLKLESLRHLLPGEHHSRLQDISDLIKQIVNDTRSLTFEISPPVLYELGLRQAVMWLAETFGRQFAMCVEVQGDEELLELAEGVRVMLFRSIQELLTNIIKYAQATRTVILLENADDELRVVVEDDGVGFDAASRSAYPSAAGGFGLFSIRERIGHLGGRVTVESSPGKGTRVELWVPSVDAGSCPEE